MLNRRDFLRLIATTGACGLFCPSSLYAIPNNGNSKDKSPIQIPDDESRHAYSLNNNIKYPADFQGFDYINTQAAKNGTLNIGSTGRFDSLNPFIIKGNAVNVTPFIFETLMIRSFDEVMTSYGLIAERITVADDYSWCIFHINKLAKWHDGSSISPQDVIWSFNTLIEYGRPSYQLYYQNIDPPEQLDSHSIIFRFKQKYNKELPSIIGQLPILPMHWWTDTKAERDFTASTTEKLMGSGSYKIINFDSNRMVEFEYVENHWGVDLPVYNGMHNIDKIRMHFFMDDAANFQAFKSGQIDFRRENIASQWVNGYNFPAVINKKVITEEVPTKGATPIQFFAFNLRLPKFQNRDVREAIALAFDFEWTNRVIFALQYARPTSYFQGTDDLMSTGPPDDEELRLLEPYKDILPSKLFTQPFSHPTSSKNGRNRRNLSKAKTLLKQAGWHTNSDGKLTNSNGDIFTITFISNQPTQEKVVAPYAKNLNQIGITASFKYIEHSQYISRLLANQPDFDIIVSGFTHSEHPGFEQYNQWGSDAAHITGSANIMGISDPVIDSLIPHIVNARTRKELSVAVKALDRVLLWNHYTVLELYQPFTRIAYWEHLQHPQPFARGNIGFPDIWWINKTQV